MRPPTRWIALTAFVGALAACVAASAPEPCRCGPTRPATSVAEAEPGAHAADDAHAADGPAAPPSVPAPAADASPAETDDGPPALDDPAWTRVPSRAGRYVVLWRSLAGAVPRNRDFDMEVWVLRDGAPAQGAHLSVNAWMPDHGHGMLRRPRAEARGDGSFLVEGMLLHMRGRWTLLFDVLEDALAETAEDELEL